MDDELSALSSHIEGLIDALEASGSPAVVARARELVGLLLEVHGATLVRVLEVLDGAGPPGRQAVEQLLADDLVEAVLALHGLVDLPGQTVPVTIRPPRSRWGSAG